MEKEDVVESEYLKSLDNKTAQRYKEKIGIINNLDPYTLKRKELNENIELYPAVMYPDMVNYFLFAPSPLTSDELKCYKSLQSYNNFLQGWVQWIGVRQFAEKGISLSFGRVKHSQRLSETPTATWIITEVGGKIVSAHCNFMAGLGESGSHVSAMLFYVEAAVRLRESKTVTEEKAYWMLPAGHKDIEYKEVVDIDFTAPKTLKARLDCKISGSQEGTGSRKAERPRQSCFQKYNPPSELELTDFYAKLSECGSKLGLLSIISPYSKQYVPKLLKTSSYPLLLTELYDPNVIDKNYAELIELFGKVEILVTKEQQTAVEKITRMQADSKNWFQFRAGRITASKVYGVCHTDLASPSQSLIKSICYPESYKFSTSATSWGCVHEKIAREMYETGLKDEHHGVNVQNSGLHISVKNPFLGASPDALVSCRCCGEGCLEIKCPFCCKDMFIFEAAENKKFCLEKNGSEFQLSRKHPYYYQVQAQLNICERKYCDFYVWTEKDYHVERILPDPNFWNSCVEKSSRFFVLCVLPELVGKFYSRETHILKDVTNSMDTNSTDIATKKVFCYCRQPESDEMIGCDNEQCKMEWFHFKCLKLNKAPKGKWYCPDCRKLDQFRRRKKSDKKSQ